MLLVYDELQLWHHVLLLGLNRGPSARDLRYRSIGSPMTATSGAAERARPWLFGALALIAVAGVAAWLSTGESDTSPGGPEREPPERGADPPPDRGSGARNRGIPPRPPEVGTGAPVVLPRFDGRDDLEDAANDAQDLGLALADGDTRWEPTLVELLASDEAMDAYWTCSKAHLRSSCHFGLRLVLVPDGEGRAVVGYGRADEMSNCPEYAECMARAFVGRSVPLPADVRAPVGYRLERTDNTLAGLVDDPDRLRRTVEALRHDLDGIDEADAGIGQPDWGLRVAEHRARLRLLERILASLED